MGTRESILKVAKEEFLQGGYEGVSLRKIAAKCNITTGAIYGIFKNKNEIFATLVEDDLRELERKICNASDHFKPKERPPHQSNQEYMMAYTKIELELLMDLLEDYGDSIELVVFHSKGSHYENALDFFIQKEVTGNLKFLEQSLGRKLTFVEVQIVHHVSNGFVTGILELFRKPLSKRDRNHYISRLVTFYLNGWSGLLTIDKNMEEL